jgi:hypothetical protein
MIAEVEVDQGRTVAAGAGAVVAEIDIEQRSSAAVIVVSEVEVDQ